MTRISSLLLSFRLHSAVFIMVWIFSSYPLSARMGTPPPGAARQLQPLGAVRQLVLPPIDVSSELAADRQRTTPGPMRFAVPRKLTASPETHGTWERVSDGSVWRLRILCAGATDLNLGFTTFWLPQGATLHVAAEDGSYFQGPYTARDNKPHGQLWTPLIPGHAAIVEVFVPDGAAEQPRIVLGQVAAGYRDMFRRKANPDISEAAGTCNNDVVCPIAAAWTNEIRSVALYSVEGYLSCSGTLVADAAESYRSFFLTADHCGIDKWNALSVVVYWNYESPTCGTHGPGSLNQNQSGAIFRAARADVDFALIELEEMPDFDFNVYYAGWDRSGVAPSGAVGIHHPDVDVKAISFSYAALTTVNSCIGSGGSSTHWRVRWDSGVTEPGSSGSGIWDISTHKLIGFLSGGGSSCATPNSADCYGKFSVAWNGASVTNRLKEWLDPNNTGISQVAGLDPRLTSIVLFDNWSLAAENCLATNGAIDPGETVTINVALKNIGGVATTNLQVTLLATNGVLFSGAAQDYGMLTGGGSPVWRAFTFTAGAACGGTISPVFQLQDGARQLGTVKFEIQLGITSSVPILTQNFDGVTAPSLPTGWTASTTSGTAWRTHTTRSDTPPNSAFAPNISSVADNRLVSPPVFIPTTNAQLTFRHRYETESGYDGGVLEISIAGGSYVDILTAGGTFATGPYTQTLSSGYSNPIGGRFAWSGSSGGFMTTTVNLPASAAGNTVQLRWRFGSDSSSASVGWNVDTISISYLAFTCCSSLIPPTLVEPRLVGASDAIAFSYDAIPGRTYVIEAATNLSSGGWIPLVTNTGNGTRQAFTNSAANPEQRYFRLRMY